MQSVLAAHKGSGAALGQAVRRGARPQARARMATRPFAVKAALASSQKEPVPTVSEACSTSSTSTSGAPAVPANASRPEAALLQRLVAGCSVREGSTLVLAGALGVALLLGVAEPALAASHGSGGPNPVAELAENDEFWGNVLRYISFYFSVMLGTVNVMTKPFVRLLKSPGTAVLVVAGTAGLIFFLSFTVQAMLGVTEVLDYEPSSLIIAR